MQEATERPDAPQEGRNAAKIFMVAFVVCIGGLALAAGLAAFAIPRAVRDLKLRATGDALDSLRAIQVAEQRVQREDLDQNGKADFVDLATLGALNAIGPVLATGDRNGYIFEVGPSSANPETAWWAKASPKDRNGERPYLFTNQDGVIYASPTDILFDRSTAQAPPGLEIVEIRVTASKAEASNQGPELVEPTSGAGQK